MTAPDSRDSVDKIVADLHEAIEQNCGDNIERRAFRQLADRLQALARGPQQAGGEDAPPCPVWLAGKDVSHAWAAGWNARNPHYAALQAEVARLREAGRDAERLDWLDQQRQHYHGLRMVSWGVIADSAIGIRAAIDAAIEQAAG